VISRLFPLVIVSFFAAFFSLLFVLPDYISYENIYEATSEFSLSHERAHNIHGEIGFLMASYVFNKLGFSYDLFRFFIISASVFLKIYCAKRLGANVVYFSLAYFSLFFYMDAVAIRQGLAAGLLSFALVFLIEKKYILTILFIILAAAFHKFSLVFFPILLFFMIFRRIAVFSSVLLIASITFAFFVDVTHFINIYNFYGMPYAGLIQGYQSSQYGLEVSKISGARFLYLVLLLTYFFLWRGEIQRGENIHSTILFFTLIAWCWLVLFSPMEILSERGFRIFSFAICVSISMIPVRVKPKFLSVPLFCTILIFAAYFVNPVQYTLR